MAKLDHLRRTFKAGIAFLSFAARSYFIIRIACPILETLVVNLDRIRVQSRKKLRSETEAFDGFKSTMTNNHRRQYLPQ